MTHPTTEPTPGQTYPAAILSVDLSGHSKISEGNPDNETKAVKTHFRRLVEAITQCNGGELFQWQGDGGILWFRNTDPARGALQTAQCALSLEDAVNLYEDLTDRFGVKAVIHFGHITWDKDAGSVHSTDLNLLGHIAKQKSFPGAIVVTQEFYKELPKRLKAFFIELGPFETTRLYIWRPDSPATISPPPAEGVPAPTESETVIERPERKVTPQIIKKASDEHDAYLKRTLSLLQESLPIKRQEGRQLVEAMLQRGADLGTEIARLLFAVVVSEAYSDEERAFSLNLLTRGKFWAPHQTLFTLWTRSDARIGKRLSSQLTLFFAQPDNPGLAHLIAMASGIRDQLARLDENRLFDILNVFRCALGWQPLPDTAYVETMLIVAKSLVNHSAESVKRIAEEIVEKVEGRK